MERNPGKLLNNRWRCCTSNHENADEPYDHDGRIGDTDFAFPNSKEENTNNKIMILRMTTACSKKKKEHAKDNKRFHYYITTHVSNHNHCNIKTYFKQF